LLTIIIIVKVIFAITRNYTACNTAVGTYSHEFIIDVESSFVVDTT